MSKPALPLAPVHARTRDNTRSLREQGRLPCSESAAALREIMHTTKPLVFPPRIPPAFDFPETSPRRETRNRAPFAPGYELEGDRERSPRHASSGGNNRLVQPRWFICEDLNDGGAEF
ncbi:hypothetical protein KM043_006874 [Ampulex compressa]|nr:hypothetical protein KM043_006874 [Ampulex compressa]